MGVCQFNRPADLRGLARAMAAVAFAALLTTGGAGCQQPPTVSHTRLIQHQAMIDFSGLKPAAEIPNLNARGGVPRNWEQLDQTSNPLYTHQQWKSPSTKTGVGVANIRLPLPLSTRMVVWLAKREYTKKANDGRVISEWTDDLGRPWFEAENDKYRVRGYVVVSGWQAWVIYFGHKSKFPPDPAELSLAARAADSIVPNLRSKPTKPAAKLDDAAPDDETEATDAAVAAAPAATAAAADR